MFIGIAFMLYTLTIILGILVNATQTKSLPFLILCMVLEFVTWLVLGLITIGIL